MQITISYQSIACTSGGSCVNKNFFDPYTLDAAAWPSVTRQISSTYFTTTECQASFVVKGCFPQTLIQNAGDLCTNGAIPTYVSPFKGVVSATNCLWDLDIQASTFNSPSVFNVYTNIFSFPTLPRAPFYQNASAGNIDLRPQVASFTPSGSATAFSVMKATVDCSQYYFDSNTEGLSISTRYAWLYSSGTPCLNLDWAFASPICAPASTASLYSRFLDINNIQQTTSNFKVQSCETFPAAKKSIWRD